MLLSPCDPPSCFGYCMQVSRDYFLPPRGAKAQVRKSLFLVLEVPFREAKITCHFMFFLRRQKERTAAWKLLHTAAWQGGWPQGLTAVYSSIPLEYQLRQQQQHIFRWAHSKKKMQIYVAVTRGRSTKICNTHTVKIRQRKKHQKSCETDWR